MNRRNFLMSLPFVGLLAKKAVADLTEKKPVERVEITGSNTTRDAVFRGLSCGSTSTISMHGGSLTYNVGTGITMMWDGTDWREVSRTVNS